MSSAIGAYDSSLSIPAAWLGAVLAQPAVEGAQPAAGAGAQRAREVTSPPGSAGLIASALRQPIAAPRLADLARAGQRAVILVDDCTRKTPTAQILPRVLAELALAGVQPSHITLVVALGTHRPLTTAELRVKLQPALDAGCTVVNTPATDLHAFAPAGFTASLRPDLGLPPIPAQISRAVLEADLRIGIGMITPHLDAGYSGGAKIVLPGVCSLQTVDAFHLHAAFVEGNQLGNPDAPLRLLLEGFVAEHAPLHFVVNVVLRTDGALAGCVAGDPVLAQRAGAQIARQVHGLCAPRRFPVVVAHCAPYDQDLWQSIKGAWAGDLLAEDGGDLIVVTPAAEGNSLYPHVPRYAGMDPDDLRAAILQGSVEDAMQAATGVLWGTLRRRLRLSLISAGLGAETARLMGADPYPSVAAAVAAAVQRLPAARRQGSVAVIPQAGVALPLLQAIDD